MIFDDTIDIIVYRDGTEVLPENSIQEIVESLKELPNALIELDLQITKDFEMFAEAENKFFLKVVEASIEFLKDYNGNVSKLVLKQNGQVIEALKR